MELELIRTYHDNGTNGEILLNNRRLCFTIELPWLRNANGISCIPEGRYELIKRYSLRFQWHLFLLNVENRRLILIHPANHARRELKGCIAPVSILDGPGRGSASRKAFGVLKAVVFPALEKKEPVYLTIKSKLHEAN